jgi:general nucleoside transport system permease protein
MNAGSAVLQMMTDVSKYLVQVLQFIIVLILAAQFSLSWWTRTRAGVAAQAEPNAKVEAEGDEAAGPA